MPATLYLYSYWSCTEQPQASLTALEAMPEQLYLTQWKVTAAPCASITAQTVRTYSPATGVYTPQ